MQLKEIRNLLVLFLKQFSKEDVNLLLNYLPIFLEDIQRDPLLLDKLPCPANICLDSSFSANSVLPEKSKPDYITSFRSEPVQNANDHLTPNIILRDFDDHEDSNHTIAYSENNQLNPNRYSNQVIDYLNKCYMTNKYPKSGQLRLMSEETNLTPKQIQTWFSNTRFKLKHSRSQLSPKKIKNEESLYKDDDSDSNFLSIDENRNNNEEIEQKTEPTRASLKDSTPSDLEELSDEMYQLIINRTRLPLNILDYLIRMYKINKYPTSDEIYQISLETNLPTKKIKNWFDSTRFKLKHAKKNKKTKLNDEDEEYDQRPDQPDLNETNSVDILNDNEANSLS